MNMGEEIEYEGLSGEGTLHVAEKNPNIRIHLERLNHADGYQITIPKLDVIVPEDRLIRIKNTIYHCTPEFTETLQPLLNLADPNRERKLLACGIRYDGVLHGDCVGSGEAPSAG